VLQYLPYPEKIIRELAEINAETVILDRTIINRSVAHRVYIQHVPPSIYAASYPCYSLSESRLIESMSSNYEMIADFASLSFPALLSIDAEFKGYIFKRVC